MDGSNWHNSLTAPPHASRLQSLYVQAASIQAFQIALPAAEATAELGQRVAIIEKAGCAGLSRGLTADHGVEGE